MLLTRPPVGSRVQAPQPSRDLHVLSTPPAFVLSQDQTLHYLKCSKQLCMNADRVVDPDRSFGNLRCLNPLTPESNSWCESGKQDVVPVPAVGPPTFSLETSIFNQLCLAGRSRSACPGQHCFCVQGRRAFPPASPKTFRRSGSNESTPFSIPVKGGAEISSAALGAKLLPSKTQRPCV